MDAENLRVTYNRYFSSERNLWTSTDQKKTMKVAGQVVRWLSRAGYSKKENCSMLDVGCASGYYTQAFRKLGYNATGLDYSEVAVQQATVAFPDCKFVQMNGFEPVFHEKFDLIFCRGFSGANTHDVSFIATWLNKYIPYLSSGGFFILGYSSDFSGKEKEGETVNLNRQEIEKLASEINATYCGMQIFHYFGWISRLKKFLTALPSGKKEKVYYYMLFRKD